MGERFIIETNENNIRHELLVRVVREQREGKPSGLVDLLVECERGTLPIGGSLNYPSDIGQFWLVQTGGNVFEGVIGYEQPWVFRIVDDEQEDEMD